MPITPAAYRRDDPTRSARHAAGAEADIWSGVSRRDPAVAKLIARWKRLSGGARTLIACSAGADSTALTLVLRAASSNLAVAHVLHDLRPAPVARADRDAAKALADRCGLPFFEAAVAVPPGNAEANARHARYAALARLANESGYEFVATAHHAGDQLEGLIMALVRGAGPAGLAAARESRPIECPDTGAAATLIRPALRTERAVLESICRDCGAEWRTDETNFDVSRDRAALRHGPLAEIESLRPGAAARAARTADLLRDAAELIEERAQQVFGDQLEWPREKLRAERPVVLAAGLRRAFLTLTGGAHADKLDGETLDRAIEAIRSPSGEHKELHWPRGVSLIISRDRVGLAARGTRTG